MMPAAVATTPIINERRFILATRDTGYRSTAAAVAELVDNAVQAGATIIRIFVNQYGIGTERELSLAVLDNGSGMDSETLSIAMQFAGSSRFNDRNGLGRFGMGLPNSSVSQARRVDVYTWQDRDRVLHTYLDVDEIVDGRMIGLPRPRIAELPPWAEKYTRRRSGTLVYWSRCDRLDHRKSKTIAEKLHRPLSQRFRHYLWQGNKIYINELAVVPFDPLYLKPEGDLAPAQPFGDVMTLEFRKPNDPNATSTVRVRFTELPISKWANLPVEVKRDLGITKGAGVSIVRANREIDYGWYFMGGKRKENYDDWWRCEISFDPELDELFGVTHSKQEINPTDLLKTELCQNLEGIAQTLNSRARSAFLLVRKQEQREPSSAETKAKEREPFLPPTPLSARAPRPNSNKIVPATKSAPDELEFRIRSEPLKLPDLFIWEPNKKGLVTLTVNENHAFFDHVFSRLENMDDQTKHAIECLLLALARAEIAVTDLGDSQILAKNRRSFSNILAAYLGD